MRQEFQYFTCLTIAWSDAVAERVFELRIIPLVGSLKLNAFALEYKPL